MDPQTICRNAHWLADASETQLFVLKLVKKS